MYYFQMSYIIIKLILYNIKYNNITCLTPFYAPLRLPLSKYIFYFIFSMFYHIVYIYLYILHSTV